MFGTDVPRPPEQQFSAATLWESRLTVRCRPGCGDGRPPTPRRPGQPTPAPRDLLRVIVPERSESLNEL